jgi:hypothetical protein
MLLQWIEKVGGPEKRDLAMTAGGMLALLAGRKATAVGLFARGLAGLEQGWRAKHPEFQGGIKERWALSEQFYEETHQDETNRWLHIVGIPIIVAGTAGLLVFPSYRPMWAVSAGAFVAGWGLNFIGHGVFEKKAPAFADDPLSFIAGPVWDLRQVGNRIGGAAPVAVEASA